jgi:SagB-type dehydrogenase family enzyme
MYLFPPHKQGPKLRHRRGFLRHLLGTGLAACSGLFFSLAGGASPGSSEKQETLMKLPPPDIEGAADMRVAAAINQRRTVRAYNPRPLSLAALSQLLWAAQGITGRRHKRAAPSAGALYPMDLYTVAGTGTVTEMAAGVFHYRPAGHELRQVSEGDLRTAAADAALGQGWMTKAPVNLVITAEYERVMIKYGDRGVRYALIEAGCIGQNIFLQAEALGLKAGMVGAFRDRALGQALHLPPTHEPLLIMPVGHARRGAQK